MELSANVVELNEESIEEAKSTQSQEEEEEEREEEEPEKSAQSSSGQSTQIDEMKVYYLDVSSVFKRSLPSVTVFNASRTCLLCGRQLNFFVKEKDTKQPKFSEAFSIIRVDVLQCVDFDHNTNKYYFLELQESVKLGKRISSWCSWLSESNYQQMALIRTEF